MRGSRRAVLFLVSAIGLAGCGLAVDPSDARAPASQAAIAVPRPGEVLVQDFALDWHTVQLDEGVRARMERQGGNPSDDQRNLAAEVQSAITETLIEQINAMGLNAIHATAETRPRPGDVIVGGQIVKVDAGNSTRRALIGFGAGKSEVYADVQVSRATPGGSQFMQTFDASANSGHTPGLGVGAAGAAAGHVALAAAGSVAGTAARHRQGLAKDGENLAKRVSVNIGKLFAAQGWIAPSAVP